MREAIELYLAHNLDVAWDDYLFQAEGNRKSESGHLNRKSVYRIITGVVADLNIPCKAGTHTLRKTFGYQLMAQADNDHKVDTLLLLQEILGHSDLRVTRRYIGITVEDVAEAYHSLCLGMDDGAAGHLERSEAELCDGKASSNHQAVHRPSWNPVVVQGRGVLSDTMQNRQAIAE